ncbi:MAG: glycoside hydrolase family 88 protein [Anaerolineae bacterium]|nr:glycoside hydrolase family 88 protein [Anaerolineae bacterium]
MTDSVMQRHDILMPKWAYEWGVVLKGIEQVWQQTGDQRYFDYIKRNIDEYVQPDGSIRTYRPAEYNIDHINTGKLLFGLWRETGDERYRKAIYRLREQLNTHPRTSENGFWHKNIYPHQMWLDGIYMGGPFYAEFARTFAEPAGFDDVAHQIILIEAHTRDPQTGLLYHGWDESKTQQWADPETGCSPHFWGRAIGWYMMAIPDILEHLPTDHPQRDAIIAIFQKTLDAIANVQDPATGLWYQVLDQGDREGNYLEASASCMVVYGIAKAVRLGIIDPTHLDIARKGYAGIVDHLITVDDQGLTNLNQICSVAGLGGNPYRDGSFAYYISEPVVTNDFKGMGAFILASAAIEALA